MACSRGTGKTYQECCNELVWIVKLVYCPCDKLVSIKDVKTSLPSTVRVQQTYFFVMLARCHEGTWGDLQCGAGFTTRRCVFSSFDLYVMNKTVLVRLNEVRSEVHGGPELMFTSWHHHWRQQRSIFSTAMTGKLVFARVCKLVPRRQRSHSKTSFHGHKPVSYVKPVLYRNQFQADKRDQI